MKRPSLGHSGHGQKLKDLWNSVVDFLLFRNKPGGSPRKENDTNQPTNQFPVSEEEFKSNNGNCADQCSGSVLNLTIGQFKTFNSNFSDRDSTNTTFRHIKTLGHSSGSVVLAADNHGEQFVLKVINKRTHLSSKFSRKLLRREVHLHSQLVHPNIIRLNGVFEKENEVVLVMEAAPHGDLLNKRLSEWQVLHVARDISKALRYCHARNIVHGDVTEEHVVVGTDGRSKLIDFGCSLQLGGKKLWKGGVGLVGEKGEEEATGMREYRAPEIWDKRKYRCGVMADMWALGVMMYKVLYGEVPFKEDSARYRWSWLEFPEGRSVSEEGQDFIRRLLIRDSKKRMTAAEALRHPWMFRHVRVKAAKRRFSPTNLFKG